MLDVLLFHYKCNLGNCDLITCFVIVFSCKLLTLQNINLFVDLCNDEDVCCLLSGVCDYIQIVIFSTHFWDRKFTKVSYSFYLSWFFFNFLFMALLTMTVLFSQRQRGWSFHIGLVQSLLLLSCISKTSVDVYVKQSSYNILTSTHEAGLRSSFSFLSINPHSLEMQVYFLRITKVTVERGEQPPRCNNLKKRLQCAME